MSYSQSLQFSVRNENKYNVFDLLKTIFVWHLEKILKFNPWTLNFSSVNYDGTKILMHRYNVTNWEGTNSTKFILYRIHLKF